MASGCVAVLRESSAPLVGHEERTDATDQADDSDGPEHRGAYELEASETCHDQEDDTRDEETEADEVDSHCSLSLGRAARRNVTQLGDLTDVPVALSVILSPVVRALRTDLGSRRRVSGTADQHLGL